MYQNTLWHMFQTFMAILSFTNTVMLHGYIEDYLKNIFNFWTGYTILLAWDNLRLIIRQAFFEMRKLFQTGYTSISCSKIEHILYNLVFTTKSNLMIPRF
jgi:hypothetical protein